MFNTFFGANLFYTSHQRVPHSSTAWRRTIFRFVWFGLGPRADPDLQPEDYESISNDKYFRVSCIGTLSYIRYQIINLHHFTYFKHFYISIHHILYTMNTRAIHNTRIRASIYLLWRSKPPLRHLPEEFGDVDRLVNAMSFEQPDGNPGKLDIRAIVTTYAPIS